jgi:hypothetical protein
MKKQNNIRITGFALGCILFGFLGCKKNENFTIPEEKGTIEFHIHTMLGSHEISDYFSADSLDDGRNITIEKARLYLSNIQLEKVDGSLVTLEGRIILTENGIETYNLGLAPVGNYVGIRFYLGLNQTQNFSPQLNSDSMLETSSMWLGPNVSTEGRKFIHFKGKIDTSTAGIADTSAWKAFDFQLGTSLHYQQVVLPNKNFSILQAYPYFVHLEIDFAKLLEGVDLSQTDLNVIGTSGNLGALSEQLKLKTVEMVKYEE